MKSNSTMIRFNYRQENSGRKFKTEKEKYTLLEKVRANKELEQKRYSDHMQKILTRSSKQEQACIRLQQKHRFFKIEKDQKAKEQRTAAMSRVKEIMSRKQELGD